VVTGHAFVSYVREDASRVDRLQRILSAANISVWRDTDSLWPGDDWRSRIRSAISDEAFVFVACFSNRSEARQKSGQNEELILAIDELRKRRPDDPWLIPVRFDDCPTPELEIGGGRTLGAIHRVDLIGDDWDEGAARLVGSIARILGRPSTQEQASPLYEEQIKKALRDPAGDIALNDLIMPIADRVRGTLADKERYPISSKSLEGSQGAAHLYLASVAEQYLSDLDVVLETLLIVCRWAQPLHTPIIARFVERVFPNMADSGGMQGLRVLRWFPIPPVMYASALAAVASHNYEALRAVVLDARVRDGQDGRVPLLARGHVYLPFTDETTAQVLAFRAAGKIVTPEFIDRLPHGGKRHTPVSDFLHDTLRDRVRGIEPDDDEYSDLFDRAEVLLALLALDLKQHDQPAGAYFYGPTYGRFTWRRPNGRSNLDAVGQLKRDFLTYESQWWPLTAGLFKGSTERAIEAFQALEAGTAEARRSIW